MKQNLSLKVEVPNASYRLRYTKVYLVNNKLIALLNLTGNPDVKLIAQEGHFCLDLIRVDVPDHPHLYPYRNFVINGTKATKCQGEEFTSIQSWKDLSPLIGTTTPAVIEMHPLRRYFLQNTEPFCGITL